MIFKTWFRGLCRMYRSIFRPPSADVGFIRRERLSIGYAISSFSLFVLSTYLIFKRMEDPEFMEKATLKPPPNAKHIKFEFDAKTFTFSKKNVENEDIDQEKYSS